MARRLFIAVRPEPAALDALVALQLQWRTASFVARAEAGRWTVKDKLHLTLHFLGPTPESQLAPLRSRIAAMVLRDVLEGDDTQVLSEGYGFPHADQATVLALGSPSACRVLESAYKGVGQTLAELGIPTENRPYVPHVTLARWRRPICLDLKGEKPIAIGVAVRAVALYESVRDHQGSRYEMIQEFPLLSP